MQNVNMPTGKALAMALDNIRRGRRLQSEGRKLEEIGKAYFADFLKTQRNIDVLTLDIGERISINNGVALIVIDKQNRLDEKALAIANPALYFQHKRDFPIVQFKV